MKRGTTYTKILTVRGVDLTAASEVVLIDLKKKVEQLYDIPKAPSTDGSYTLNCTVTNGIPIFTWISTGETRSLSSSILNNDSDPMTNDGEEEVNEEIR